MENSHTHTNQEVLRTSNENSQNGLENEIKPQTNKSILEKSAKAIHELDMLSYDFKELYDEHVKLIQKYESSNSIEKVTDIVKDVLIDLNIESALFDNVEFDHWFERSNEVYTSIEYGSFNDETIESIIDSIKEKLK